MVTFIPARNDWAEAFEKFGSGVSKGYMNRSDENALRKSISELGENPSARQILDTITNTKTYTPAAKQQALQNYLGVEKFEELKRKAKSQEEINKAKNDIAASKEAREKDKLETERTNTKAIVNQLDLPPEQKESLGETLSKDAAESLLKEQLKPKDQKMSPFQKKLADDYFDTVTKEIPKLETTLEDINYARKLSNDLGYVGSALGAAGLSGKAKELENVSFTLMEPIVKIFNPSGPIAQQKLKTIQDKYVINASDAPWTKEAKLDALERFAKQALGRAQEKVALIKKYDGNPPEAEVQRFDKESDTLSDAMVDYDLVGEEVKEEGMPNPDKFKGKTITSPEGQKYYSDGTRWVKK